MAHLEIVSGAVFTHLQLVVTADYTSCSMASNFSPPMIANIVLGGGKCHVRLDVCCGGLWGQSLLCKRTYSPLL